MSESKHTPGPWTLNRHECSIGCCDDLHQVLAQYPDDNEPKRPLASVDGGNAVWLREGEAEANARLIAAAPDLLAALQEIVESIEEWEAAVREIIHVDPKHGMDLTKARAAIAKATSPTG